MVSNPIPHLIFWLVLLTVGAVVGRYHARHTVPAWADQVQGRRTGLSECAFPFGQTERRAKRTLDRPPP
jgi:disulfide bond formation protein DsbB